MPRLFALLVLYAAVCGGHGAGTVDTDVADPKTAALSALRQASHDGVVSLDPVAFAKYAKKGPRPYTLVLFLDARNVQDHTLDNLQKIRAEFGMLASSCRAAGPAEGEQGEVFFADMVFEEAQHVFRALGVEEVPSILHWGRPHVKFARGRYVVPEDFRMGIGFTQDAEGIRGWLETKGVRLPPVHRPTMRDQAWYPAAVGAMWAGIAGAAYVLLGTELPGKPWAMAVAGIAVYSVSIGGLMFNVIKGVPWSRGRPGAKEFISPSAENQLGLEGMLMGALVSGAGLAVAAVVGVAGGRRAWVQRLVGWPCLAAAAYAIYKTLELHQWKTDIRPHGYWSGGILGLPS